MQEEIVEGRAWLRAVEPLAVRERIDGLLLRAVRAICARKTASPSFNGCSRIGA